MGFDIRFQLFAALRAIRYIELQDPRGAAHLLNLRLNGFRLVPPRAAVQDNVMTTLRQAQGNGAADAAAGTGDKDAFTHGEGSCR